MKKRPESLIRIALVKFLSKVGGQVDSDARLIFAEKLEHLWAFLVVSTRPPDPNAATLFENRVHGSGQAAGASFRLPSDLLFNEGDGQPIRNHDQARVSAHKLHGRLRQPAVKQRSLAVLR